MCGSLQMIRPVENQDLSLLDICLIGATSFITSFPLEVSGTTIHLDYSALLTKIVHCFVPANVIVRLWLFTNITHIAPLKA